MTSSASGPRIAPLPPDQWDERLTKLLSASPGGLDEPMHIFTTLAKNPELFRRWLGFGGALLAGTLPGRLRELLILRTAYRFDGAYEWAQHIEIGARAGLSPAEMTAVGSNLDDHQWDPVERAALAAVDETASDGAVGDATWATLAGAFSEAELLELLMVIAHYLMLTTVLRSLRVELEPRAAALAASIPTGPGGAA
jgi:alkylhydroperoxidase family enzyme